MEINYRLFKLQKMYNQNIQFLMPIEFGKDVVAKKDDFQRIEISGFARYKILQAAREQRKNPTESEQILWESLRGKRLDGVKFRRQQPIGPFIADFYSSAYRLVVEVDGGIHQFQRREDAARDEMMKELGLNILRIPAELVENDLDSALDKIRAKIKELSVIPPC